jgi:hypothetical protein
MGRENSKKYPQKIRIGSVYSRGVDNIPEKMLLAPQMWINSFLKKSH